jgi:hypothetical protein
MPPRKRFAPHAHVSGSNPEVLVLRIDGEMRTRLPGASRIHDEPAAVPPALSVCMSLDGSRPKGRLSLLSILYNIGVNPQTRTGSRSSTDNRLSLAYYSVQQRRKDGGTVVAFTLARPN